MKILKLAVSTLLLTALVIPQSAHASTTGSTYAQVEFSAGTLSIAPPDFNIGFGQIALDGTIKTPTTSFTAPLSVSDLTGSGAGWYVTVEAVPMNDGNGHSLSGSNLSIQNISSVASAGGGGSTLPTVQGTGPYVIDAGGSVKILSAAIGAGMGQYNVNFPANALKLTVNTNNINVSASSYYATSIVWTVVTGP